MGIEFLVLKTSGALMYDYCTSDNKCNPAVISSFLSILSSISERALGDKINNIKMGNYNMLILENKDLQIYYSLISSKQDNKLMQYLKDLSEEFESEYYKNLEEFNGEVNQFSDFDIKVKQFIKRAKIRN